MTLVNASIGLYFFVIGFTLRRSTITSEAYDLPEPMYKRARHLILLLWPLDKLHSIQQRLIWTQKFHQNISRKLRFGVYILITGTFRCYRCQQHDVGASAVKTRFFLT